MSLVYFALWVILIGRITLEIVIAGAVVSLVLDQFVKHILGIRFTGATLWRCLKLFPDAVFYVTVLLIEVIKAACSITCLVFAANINVEPCLVKFSVPLRTNAAKIVLANSITLTPGNITVSLEGNEFLVHTLNRKTAAKLDGGILERLLARMERIVNA